MKPATFLFLAFLSSFAIRIVFTIWYRGSLETVPVHQIAGADGVEYDLLARNMAEGLGYVWNDGTPTSFRAPGLPLWLAGLYAIAGVNYMASYLSFAFLGGAGTIATYCFVKELAGDNNARIATCLAAVYPGDVYSASYFFSENLFVPCLGFGAWQFSMYLRNGRWLCLCLAGFLLGFAAMTRSFGILFLPLLFLYIIWPKPSLHSISHGFIFASSFLAAVLPWTYRNTVVHQQFVLIATNGGSTFYGANNDVVAGSVKEYGNWVSTTRLPGRDLIDAQPDEVSHDKMEWKLGIEWCRSNPGRFLMLVPFKIMRFCSPFVQYPSFKIYPIANILLVSPFLALMGIGFFKSIFSTSLRRRFAVAHLIILANVIMVSVFWGDPRFRDANLPALMLYSAIGWKTISQRFASATRQNAVDRKK